MQYAIILVFLIVIVICVIFFVTATKKNNDSKVTDKSKNSNTSSSKVKRDDVFNFMEFDRIQDNMIVQNNGKRYTMAIRCKGINYDLMSEVEQMAVEQGFITFLNTLKYPIQLYVQAQNVDLKNVVNDYKENIIPLQEEYIKYNKLFEEKSSIFDTDREEVEKIYSERTKILNAYEYANDIISYVEKMSTNKNLLQRNFYVLVSYSKGDIAAADKFSKEEIEEMCYTELLTRCNSIISALASSSVTGKVLDSNELADLLYIAYNRDDKSLMSVREALESGYYRLYSTSRDAFEKKDELLREAISTQARLKAIDSLERAIEDNTYKTDTMKALENEEEISKEATELIKAENINPEIKEKAYNNIIDDYRKVKNEYSPKIEEEKEKLVEDTKKEKELLEEKYKESDLYKLNEHKQEVIDLYNQEIEDEKKNLQEIIEKNTNKIEDSNKEENDSII